MLAVLTTEFWLSVVIPATASITFIVAGALTRRRLLLAGGTVGLLLAAGWLVLAVYIETVIE